jgi:release factor glutamine methyltransferase
LSVNHFVAEARARLREAGIQSADLDARLLAQFVLGWTAEQLLIAAGDPAPPDFAAKYDALVARRAAREPLAYITGAREFWGLPFRVSPAVLIPRPETELIVEATLALFPERGAPLSIADACTGSGCVAIAIAHERPLARIVATDISPDALAVARQNAADLQVADRVRFAQADLLDGVDGPFDLITCNPPYVLRRSRSGLQPEVRDHEPAIALFGGDDGLDVLRRVAAQSAARLKPGGYLICEFGYGQEIEIEALIAATPGLALVELRRDLQGIARIVVVRRPA